MLYEGEEHLTKLLQPDEELKYIIVVPNTATISKLRLPDAPCLFATIDFDGDDEPKVKHHCRGLIAPYDMHKRNRHLVDNSSACISYLTENKGGTFYTVNYAKSKGVEVINIAE